MSTALPGLPERVQVYEVGPRDGLQNEQAVVPVEVKAEFVRRLLAAGLTTVELTSFVPAKWVPQLADAEELLALLGDLPGRHPVLVPTDRGLDRALAAGVDEVNVVVCVSDTFSRKNQNMSTDEAVRTAADVVVRARDAGLVTTVTLATAFGCPFEGEVDLDRVAAVAREVSSSGPDELCLADTVGVGVPTQVHELTGLVREHVEADPALRFHFHNTRNTGFANAAAAVDAGVTVLDASAGGIGGCPFAPAATGNIATDDLVYLLERMGHGTGVDLPTLMPTAGFLAEQLQHEVPALLPRAGTFP